MYVDASMALEALRIGAWPAATAALGFLARSKQAKPFRQWSAAILFEALLTMRGVDEKERHKILIDVARLAQDVALPAPEPNSAPETGPDAPPNERPHLRALPPG